MIFPNLEAIEKLSIDEKIAQFGNKRKASPIYETKVPFPKKKIVLFQES